MNSLEKVQKVMRVFKILAKIVMILSYVAAVLALVSGILLISGAPDRVIGHFMEIGSFMEKTGGNKTQIAGILFATAAASLLGGIMSTFACLYFAAEVKEGTPFTDAGADRVKRLGIIVIVLSVVSACITEVIYDWIGLSAWNQFDQTGGVTVGICLLLLAMVLRYGAELEQKSRE